MEVRLTQAGRELLGFGPDRIETNVTTDRAFALMVGGYAVADKNFMRLFSMNNPVKKKTTPKPRPKKEKATS